MLKPGHGRQAGIYSHLAAYSFASCSITPTHSPWEITPITPTHQIARWHNDGGLYCPPPSPPRLPRPSNTIRNIFFCATHKKKLVINRLKGGGAEKKLCFFSVRNKKMQTSMFAFFYETGGVLPPHHHYATVNPKMTHPHFFNFAPRLT